jgi:hypothetical protein
MGIFDASHMCGTRRAADAFTSRSPSLFAQSGKLRAEFSSPSGRTQWSFIMGTYSPVVSLEAIRTRGQDCHSRDKIVPRRFSAVAGVLWPVKTAACLAAIAKTDERTAKRWLRGEHEPPLSVVLAVIHEMLREQTELNL